MLMKEIAQKVAPVVCPRPASANVLLPVAAFDQQRKNQRTLPMETGRALATRDWRGTEQEMRVNAGLKYGSAYTLYVRGTNSKSCFLVRG
jgi:hypothetical protein